MDIGMQHGQGHAVWTWAHIENMDISTGMGIDMDMGMDKTWT
jgi:hypothetical protein